MVYRARITRDLDNLPESSIVAIKLYKPWVLDEPGQIERISRELEVGSRLSHPSLVRAIGLVSTPEGRPALVMNYYTGPTLEGELLLRRLKKHSFAIRDAVVLLRHLASAVAHLHSQGITHRDVKPANIVLTPSTPVLMDLGVVRRSGVSQLTATGVFLGTIRYAAPEYLFGEEYSESIDVFSLGAIAFELFTGELFRGSNPHWARTLLDATKPIEIDYAHLESLHSRNAAEYVRFLIEATTEKYERISAADLVSALNPDFVENHFFRRGLFGHAIEAGEPMVGPRVQTGRNRRHFTFPALPRPLREVAEGLLGSLSPPARTALRSSLDSNWWSDDRCLLSPIPDAATMHELYDANLINHADPELGEGDYMIHPVVVLAARYGYI